MPLNNEYDPFASIYNRHWGAEYRRKALPILKRLLLARIAPGSAVLDVCCGTGQLTAKCARLGFKMTGIDASAEMLTHAQRNAPDADLRVADVRRFTLPHDFAAAYSVFESLNHVPGIADLTRAFRNVRRCLQPGAPFLFDLNNEDAFGLYWNTTDALVEKDAVCVLRMEYDESTRIGTCRFTSFEPQAKAWARNDFTIRQTCHAGEDVHKALRKAGFSAPVMYRAVDIGMSGHTGFGREFYLTHA